jgi:enoyl-CoA hydratase/carnithine racemase
LELTYGTILVEIDRGVALVTLNRPGARNAMNLRMSHELGHAFTALDDDDDVRAIVVTGAGSAFCAGTDLDPGETVLGRAGGAPSLDVGPPLSDLSPWEMATPVLAAINGAAVGLGLTYPMQWDIRIAARDAKLGFVFNRRGLLPEGNSLWLLPRLVGVARSLELLLTGRVFTGAEAAEMGLVNQAVAPDEVVPTTLAIAHEIADQTAPLSTAITKRLFYRYLETGDRQTTRREEREFFRWLASQPDSQEGIASFLEKRPPRWTMSKTADLSDVLGRDAEEPLA